MKGERLVLLAPPMASHTNRVSKMEMHADDEFTMAFDFASGATAERFQNPLWFVTDVFLGSKFRKSVATVKAFGRGIVAKAVADRRETGRVEAAGSSRLDETSGSLIQSLLDAIGDEQMVSDASLNYLSAGATSPLCHRLPHPPQRRTKPSPSLLTWKQDVTL